MDTTWKTKPFLRVLLPYILGIILADSMLDRRIFLLLFSAVFLSTLLLFYLFPFRRQITLGAMLLILYFSSGYFGMKWHTGDSYNNDLPVLDKGKNMYYQGQVKQIKQTAKGIQYILKLHKAQSKRREITGLSSEVLLYSKSYSPRYYPGDELNVKLRLKRSSPPPNPFQFDYRAFLKYRNVAYTAWVDSSDIRLIERHPYNIYYRSAKAQEVCLRVIRNNIGEGREAAIVSALILGEKSKITRDIRTVFANTGALHVLAVSGLHVGIIFLILRFLFGFFPLYPKYWQQIKIFLIIAGIWGFSFITGMSQSTIRAAVMFSLIASGSSFYRRSDIYNTIALSALIILLIEPYALFQVGFQLSYLATTGIVFFFPVIERIVPDAIPGGIRKLLNGTVVGIAAQMISFPFLIYYFHQFSFAFLLSNFIILPLAFGILMLGWMMIGMSLMSSVMTAKIGLILKGISGLLYEILRIIDQIPYLQWKYLYLARLDLILLLGAMVIVMGTISYKKKTGILLSLLLLSLVHLRQHIRRNRIENTPRIIFYASNTPLVDVWIHGKLFCRRESEKQEDETYVASGLRAYFGMQPEYLTPGNRLRFDKMIDLCFDRLKFDKEIISWGLEAVPATKSHVSALVLSSPLQFANFRASEYPALKHLIIYDMKGKSHTKVQVQRINIPAGCALHIIDNKHSLTLNLPL